MFLGGITKESWSEMGLTLRIFNIYQSVSVGDYSFSTYPKVSEKLKFLTPWCANQGVRNVSFSENFAHELNEWFLTEIAGSKL